MSRVVVTVRADLRHLRAEFARAELRAEQRIGRRPLHLLRLRLRLWRIERELRAS